MLARELRKKSKQRPPSTAGHASSPQYYQLEATAPAPSTQQTDPVELESPTTTLGRRSELPVSPVSALSPISPLTMDEGEDPGR